MPEPTRGICVVCGCVSPVQWADVDAQTVCLSCVSDAAAEIVRLRYELARLTAWHPESQKPKVGVCVLAHYADGSSGFDYWDDETGWESAGHVTHWRKLPPGPSEVTT